MEKVKVGIIGAGGISHCHVSGYQVLGNVEIIAVCDINENRVNDYAKKYNIPKVYSDYDEMLRLEELDAVNICTWNNIHAPAAIAALKAGKHVLCEKPMALSAREAEEMVKAEKESGKMLMVGFVRRFGNDAKILKDFIDNGMLGDIYYAKASYLRRNGCPGGWFGNRKLSGGGPLIDLGVHVIDLVRYLMGKPKVLSVSGVTFKKLGARKNIAVPKSYVAADQSDTHDVEDLAIALIKFDNGSVLSVETSFSLNIKNDSGNIELFGTKSGAKLDPKLEFFSEMNNYLVDVIPTHDTALNFNGLFESEISHFIDCITRGTKCISTSDDGLELMRIIDAVYQSASTGREILF